MQHFGKTMSKTPGTFHGFGPGLARLLGDGDPEQSLDLLALARLADARGASWRATDEPIEATLARFGMTCPVTLEGRCRVASA